jgi:hypothetical protein
LLGIGWPRQRWIRGFPTHQRLFETLPDRLTREFVIDVCAARPATFAGAVEAFLVSMAWGYGTTGYGVYRTSQLLAAAGAEAGPRLAAAREGVVRYGPLAGYERLANASRLPGLGPAFGTKYLFFHNQHALIHDQLMAEWFKHVTGIYTRPATWSVARYSQYPTQMCAWADEIRVAAHELERAAFQLVSTQRGNQWMRQTL